MTKGCGVLFKKGSGIIICGEKRVDGNCFLCKRCLKNDLMELKNLRAEQEFIMKVLEKTRLIFFLREEIKGKELKKIQKRFKKIKKCILCEKSNEEFRMFMVDDKEWENTIKGICDTEDILCESCYDKTRIKKGIKRGKRTYPRGLTLRAYLERLDKERKKKND